MIQLIPVIQTGAYEQTLKSLYHDSFPPDERRDWNELLQLTHHPHFNLCCIIDSEVPVGLITLWQWPEFTFIEHFAIDHAFQGRGIGSKVLNHLKEDACSKIILETEEPDSYDAKRRIAFYNRLGFHACSEEYFQPPYSLDKKAVKMLLMSYPNTITKKEFLTIRSKLYKEVYQIN